ncbi:3-deoxy-D-manno-octulosonic acid transferase [Thraustotheca clavata]|uniref:3-deoxy-D-manno-octulosonic acid transferase n=1 Tax=Thraustotheca clavata TaxID=74557 RepID=A0A1V9ZM99_9STRA|nr:3-deoxy-D-manno-octulosonic acid transferase [Thraustotheca clavata]
MLPETVELHAFDFYGYEAKGLFASNDMEEGAIVWYWDKATEPLETFTRQEIMIHEDCQKLTNFSYMVGDDTFASTLEPEKDACWYMNHSCDPNCWFDGNDQIVTKRPVKKGEQLCYDYACTESESSLHAGLVCQCGSINCRGKLKFDDWRNPKFIQANHGHLTDFIMKKYAENSWYDSRMELRYKTKTSLGLFCRQDTDCKIYAGETVLVFSGKIVHINEFLEPGAMTSRDYEMSLQIHKDLWQIPAWKETGDKIETSDYINHSCDPTCGMLDSVTVVAIRDISPGDEITIDYCMVNDGCNDQPSDNFLCNCGSFNCRREITTLDWQLPELQSRLGQYFAPFVKHLIENSPFADLVEMKAYRVMWCICRPFIEWFIVSKDFQRKVPQIATSERFGIATPPGKLCTWNTNVKKSTIDAFVLAKDKVVVWIHGASVGECLSALPLIQKLTQAPESCMTQHKVLLTTTTPSARALLQERLKSNPYAHCIFAPLDHAKYVQRFLSTWQPRAALWIESELWPNMITEASKTKIPMGLVNGRISTRSFYRWNSWYGRRLARHLVSQFSALTLCQSLEDLCRFQALGATSARFVGDLKFLSSKPAIDENTLKALKQTIQGRLVWVAVSTHEGEEDICVAAHTQILENDSNALLILIPRHPHRCKALAANFAATFPTKDAIGLRSRDTIPSPNTRVFIVDTIGETQLYFEAVSVVFVGGSLVDVGGHNILEPLRSGCTVLHGPYMSNFVSILSSLSTTSSTVIPVDEAHLSSKLTKQLKSQEIHRLVEDGTVPIQQAIWSEVDKFCHRIG